MKLRQLVYTPKGNALALITGLDPTAQGVRYRLLVYRPRRRPFKALTAPGVSLEAVSGDDLSRCPQCQGAGRIVDAEPCSICGGLGLVLNEEAKK